MQLYSPYPWNEITRRVRQANKENRQCFVAVPYCSTGARQLLPLRKGAVLVVNMSKSAVRAGLTNPTEVMKFIKAGIHVDTVSDLHAKVYVLGRYAIVGSTNASSSSAERLREAVAVSTDKQFLRECREFVDSLRGESVELEHAKSMAKLYRPPKALGGTAKRMAGRATAPTHSPLWLVPLVRDPWDEEDWEHDGKVRPVAQRRIDPDLEKLDYFAWTGSPLWNRIEKGDLVIQVMKEGRTTYFFPPAHVVHIAQFRSKNRRARRLIAYLAAPRRKQKRSRAQVAAKLKSHAEQLTNLKNARLVRKAVAAHELLRVWN